MPVNPADDVPWFRPHVTALTDAIVYTLAYADVFNYPLTVPQIHRYLIGLAASRAEVERVLVDGDTAHHDWEVEDGYYTLPGRGELVALRRRRESIAASLWRRAVRYGHLIARLPFVRMVALTGALTMGNVESSDDIDFLMVTEPGRLWLARIFVIGLIVKPGGLFGDEVCPNYFLTTETLTLTEQNLFTAHELAQMTPLYGLGVYWQMRRANTWMESFLPNAQDVPTMPRALTPHTYRVAHWLTEPLLRTQVGAWLERQERRRKIPSLAALSNAGAETNFDAEQCKGHLGNHSHTAYAAFQQRIQQFRR